MNLIEKYQSYHEFQQQAIDIIFNAKRFDKDYILRIIERIARYESELNEEKFNAAYQELLDDGWIFEESDFISFKPEDESVLTFMSDVVKTNRDKWRDKLIKNVVKYVEVEDNNDIINALKTLDRADFVPADMKAFADVDFPLRLKPGMTESALHAVLMTIKPLIPQKSEKILICGAKGGYLAALLAQIVGNKGNVVALDWDIDIINHCNNSISNFNNRKLVIEFIHKEDVTTVLPNENNWDIIIINGSIPKIPYDLLYQLNDENGRILFFMSRHDGTSQCYLIKKNQSVVKEEKLSRFRYTPIPGKYGYDLIETLQEQYDEAKNKRICIDVEYIKTNVPYPLAKSFMTAYNSRSPHEKHSKAIKIAEALLKYMAFIVISIESKNNNKELGSVLKKITGAASNGIWYGALRDILKKSDQQNDIINAINTEWNKVLRNKKVVDCYKLMLKKLKVENNKQFDFKEFILKVIEYRNGSGVGHGYDDSEAQSREIGEALIESFSVILSEFSFFKTYELIVIMGPKSMDYSSIYIKLNYVLLNGLNYEIKPIEILEEEASNWLKPTVALLKKSEKNPSLSLKPWIIWTDKGSSNDYECYMFNTGKENEYKYTTYHNKAEYPDSRVKEAFDTLLLKFPVEEKIDTIPAIKGLKKLLNIFLKDKILQKDEMAELVQYCIEEKIADTNINGEAWIRNFISEEYPGTHIE
jgi:protein-L-isoaspartate(D-aspartate) O-methyltransferase